MGEFQMPIFLGKFEKYLCKILGECTRAADVSGDPSKKWCDELGKSGRSNARERGSAIDKCVETRINRDKTRSESDISKQIKTQEPVFAFGGKFPGYPDVIVGTPPSCDAVYDIKTSCPPNKPPQRWPIYGDGTDYTQSTKNKSWYGKSQAQVYHKACGVKPKIIHKNSKACNS